MRVSFPSVTEKQGNKSDYCENKVEMETDPFVQQRAPIGYMG